MKLKKVKINRITTENNLFLAPLAGFSDFAMRSICLSFGASLAFTEMVSCKGLIYGNLNTEDLLFTTDDEKIKCAQVFGNDPTIMRKAVELPSMEKFDIVDVNFGCPMPKIFNNGEGSALLDKPELAEKIISELKKTGKIITAKIRIGILTGKPLAVDFAKALEQGGADMITVHGRAKDKIYAGEVDYDTIAEVKRAVNIPVIANGGIFSANDADKMIKNTDADGVMLARGALEKPWLFAEIRGEKVNISKKQIIRKHIEKLLTRYDDEVVAVNFRKQICLYLKGEPNSAALKEKIFALKNTRDILAAVDDFFAS
ncbi:MAG: tRNA-dihydrouridine synthase family protein [Clostridia bacterium]|nr:tRNA-dihydrouridine synthase family protein [Clostridia bacterium]